MGYAHYRRAVGVAFDMTKGMKPHWTTVNMAKPA